MLLTILSQIKQNLPRFRQGPHRLGKVKKAEELVVTKDQDLGAVGRKRYPNHAHMSA
jgi:hypothetical protein